MDKEMQNYIKAIKEGWGVAARQSTEDEMYEINITYKYRQARNIIESQPSAIDVAEEELKGCRVPAYKHATAISGTYDYQRADKEFNIKPRDNYVRKRVRIDEFTVDSLKERLVIALERLKYELTALDTRPVHGYILMERTYWETKATIDKVKEAISWLTVKQKNGSGSERIEPDEILEYINSDFVSQYVLYKYID